MHRQSLGSFLPYKTSSGKNQPKRHLFYRKQEKGESPDNICKQKAHIFIKQQIKTTKVSPKTEQFSTSTQEL
jgi:hypothetical protein